MASRRSRLGISNVARNAGGLVEDVMEHPLVELAISYTALLSVIIVIVELTEAVDPSRLKTLYIIDLLLVSVLWVDYIYRAVKSGSPTRYIRKTFYEIPALIPAGLLAFIESQLAGLGFFRLVRLVRLMRIILILSRGSRFLSLAGDAAEKVKLYHLFGAVVMTVVYGALAVYIVESPNPSSAIKSFFDALWWAIVTATTVGYGDLVPSTPLGRAIGIVVMLTGISALTLMISTVSSIFQRFISNGQSGGPCTASDLSALATMSDEEFERLIERLRMLREASKGG
ncbi:MAG: ion transporter [Aeropyrum sp.]|nr:ion transporter [Aeropyrum sp.]MCE4616267.1 ion transporter [Aeropyrum sp.]